MAINREAVVASAEKLVARGRIDGAIKEYRKLVADNPSDAMTINRLGDLYVRVNKIDEAVGLFTQIAERYTADGFFVKAIAIYKKIIKLDPTRLPVYERLAELYHKQGLVSEARTQYQVLVDYYLKHGKPDAAENVLRQMTALDSGDPSPHVKLAEIYRERGDHEREFSEYRRLAEMMLRHDRVEEASQVYARAVALAPADLGFITDAVLGLKDAGHPGAAAKLLTLAVEKNPQAAKIARIAGLEKDRRGDPSGGHPGVGESSRVFKVSDIASAPPELRVAPPRTGIQSSGSATSRPPAEPVPTGDVLSPLPAYLDASGSFAAGATGSVAEPELDATTDTDLEFVLEIEDLDSATAPPVAAETSAVAATSKLEEIPEADWSFEPEPALDFDLDLPPVGPSPPSPAAESAPHAEGGVDAGELDLSSFEVPTRVVSQAKRLGDLLAEAEVFRKYGLGEKAHDRAREILREDPRHAGAISLSALLYVDAGRFDRAFARGQELERLAAEQPAAVDAWTALRTRLEKAGFTLSDGRLAGAPAPKKAKRDSISSLLDELAGVSPPAPRATPPKAVAPDLGALVDGLLEKGKPRLERRASEPIELPADLLPPPPRRPAKQPAAALPPAIEPPAVPPPAAQSAAADAHLAEIDEAIDNRLAWLDEAAARAQRPVPPAAPATGAAAAGGDALFDEEEGFFDLAAELEEELTQVEIATGQEMLPREEPSLEEIVEGFKKGVAESLSPEDYDTHFNLGIAYREMGLLDEAIGEFQLAAKHANYLLDCCSLLGGCFLEKGLPELAVKWYEKGLATPDLSEDGRLGLLYDLGSLFVATGDADSARRTFVEIYGINSNYRDIVALLEELGAR
jgi:tetratricopeptide (TPR) repeat protein